MKPEIKADERLLVIEDVREENRLSLEEPKVIAVRALIFDLDQEDDRWVVEEIFEAPEAYWAVDIAVRNFNPAKIGVRVGKEILFAKPFKTRKAQINALLRLAGRETKK